MRPIDLKFSKNFPRCYVTLFCSHCYPNTIPCYHMYSKCYRKNKFLPCMKSVVWGWINVLKKYWRNVPFFVRSNPSADMRCPSCPLTSMSVSILSNIHTKKSSYHVIKAQSEVNRKWLITWKIIKSIYFTVTKKILENRILEIKF